MSNLPAENKTIEKISAASALLSITEIGLGSVLHSFKIPFSGHFLSLNQSFILGKIAISIKKENAARFAPAQISLISSLLKSLSPAGKKLTPMLAISAQGFLFNLGTIIFGINPIGIWAGSILLSIWAFIQPILIYMLLFGENLIYMAKYFSEKFSVLKFITIDDIWIILSIIVAIKITLATIVTFLIFLIEKESYLKWQNILIEKSSLKRSQFNHSFQKSNWKKSLKLALRDLLNPLFMVTWIFSGIFFFYVNSPYTSFVWILCRPIIIGFLLFLAIRLMPFNFLFTILNHYGFKNFSKILQSSIDKLKNL